MFTNEPQAAGSGSVTDLEGKSLSQQLLESEKSLALSTSNLCQELYSSPALVFVQQGTIVQELPVASQVP